MSDSPVQVFLVDDQQLVRAGFAMILDATPDMRVAGQAGDGQAALDVLLGENAPEVDVVLMDLRMPRVDGIEATRRLRTRTGGPAVVVLTTFDTDDDVLAALRAGASGFLLKDAGPAELLAAIRAAARGEAVVAPAVTRRLIDSYVLARPDVAASTTDDRVARLDRLDRLSDREREVLVAVGQGLSNQEIAGRLHLAEATVKTHLGAILRKLDLRDRVQAVVLAHESGLVPRP
ncbi:MAG TPA: response regulator transcription factor [Lapillicoccus sp.]|nr:response regulator transcription factor [Lapillicoccus sp.]